MKRATGILVTLLFCIKLSHAQSRILVRDIATGETRKLKRGKVVGLITTAKDTIRYEKKDGDPDRSYWYLQSFTDSSLTISYFNTAETRTYNFRDIRQVSFRRNESNSKLAILGVSGLTLLIISPFIGLSDEGYNVKGAALAGGVGLAVTGIVYFTTKHRQLRSYTIAGTR